VKTLGSRLFWGIILILGGVLFLLQSLGTINFSGLFFALVFVIVGLAFTYEFISNRDHWWAIIPGLVLLSIGVLITVAELFPALADYVGGSIILGGIGLAFLLVYLVRPAFWWALIPAGTMLSLAAITGLSNFVNGEAVGGLFLLGLAVTFAILAFIPTPMGKMRWPLIPAAVLFIIGAGLVSASADIFKYIWPILLILAGLYLFLRRPSIQP
jgi:hypothetical protein